MAVAGHAPFGGLQREDAVVVRRIAHRAADVAAELERRQPRRHRDGAAAGRAAGRAPHRPRRSWSCRTAGCRSESRRTVRAHWSCPGSPRRPRAAGATRLASVRATLSLSGGWLEVVASPATSNASLMVMGTPCSGPSPAAFFARRARSAARAAFIAPSRSTTTRALSGPFSRAIRCRCILVASTELRRPFRMARASRVAVSKHGSMHVSPAAPRH